MSGNRGKGRPKGVPNKTTAEVKRAFEMAYDHLGGQANFNKWAKTNQDIFYTQLLPKLIPVQLNHADNEGGKIVFSWQTDTKG
jgi:hypothetical protein